MQRCVKLTLVNLLYLVLFSMIADIVLIKPWVIFVILTVFIKQIITKAKRTLMEHKLTQPLNAFTKRK